jgi:hypothetical protein
MPKITSDNARYLPTTLDTWSAEDWSEGIQFDQLEPMTKVVVETRNSTYEIVVIDPLKPELLIRGGAMVPELTPTQVHGATKRGSCVKTGGVYVGFNLEFVVEGRCIITSRVRRVSVEQLAPSASGGVPELTGSSR